MFDLERAVHDWRHALEQAESFSVGNIQELEAHLREGIAVFVEKGLSREEAFLVASARLGAHSALNREYGKVNGTHVWRRRVLWMLCGYVGGIALTYAISGFSTCVGTLSAFMGFGGAPAGAAAVIAGTATWTIILFLLYFRTRRSDGGPENGYISVRWMAVLVAVMAAGGSIGMVGRIAHAHIVTVEEFGESMLWTSIGGSAVQICIAAACIGIILAIRERSPYQSVLSRQ